MCKNKLFQLILIVAISFFNFSCSKDEVEIERPEKVYYDQAQRRIKVNNYYGAIESLQKIETQYPFGKYAEQAQVELIYCQYMNGDDIAAHAASERFIRLQPRHPNIDYAYFMKGMSSYTRDSGTLARVINTDLSTRDISGAKLAFSEFTEFLTRFPDSQYAPYAKKRLVYIRNLVAKNELAAADYYIKRKAYVAAIRRANYVIENIPNSSQNHRALQILKTSYQELGYDNLVASTDELLTLNPAPPETDENSSFFERVPLPNSLPMIIAGSILSNAIN